MWVHYLVLTSILVLVCYYDLRTRKIANLWSFGLLLFLPIFYILSKHFYSWGPQHFVLPVLIVCFGFLLFHVRLLGAGDSKFLAAFLLVLPYRIQLAYLMSVILLTALLGVVWILVKLARPYLPAPYSSILIWGRGHKIPYAPIYLLGWLWVMSEQFLL